MPVPVKSKKLRRSLMRHEVHSTLREWIIDGTLNPGERLRDSELAETLGVSRMPVREALLRLEGEELVETSANRWTRVASVDAAQARRVYPILRSLEVLAISLAAPRLGESELQRMSASNERLEKALEEAQPIAASEADREFHRVFVEKSGNSDLIRLVDELKSKLRRLEIAYFGGSIVAVQAIEEHAKIIEALRERDTNFAKKTLEVNWLNSFERILARFEEDS